MKSDQGFELHPGAAQDITEIWQFIADDNPAACRRLSSAGCESVSLPSTVGAPQVSPARRLLAGWVHEIYNRQAP